MQNAHSTGTTGFLPVQTANGHFGADVDAQLDVMSSAGVEWFIMNYGSGSPLFMAFEFHGSDVTIEALVAAQRIARRFDCEPAFREELTSYALSIGSAFHEFGAANAVWRTPEDPAPAAA